MYVGVRNFKSEHCLTYLDAWEGTLDGTCNYLGEYLHSSKVLIAEVKDVINLLLRNYKGVTLYKRVDIEKCEKLIGLCYFVARYLTCHNF